MTQEKSSVGTDWKTFGEEMFAACCYLDKAIPVFGHETNAMRVRAAADEILRLREKLRQEPPSQFHAYEALKAIRNVVDSQRPPKTLEEALSDLRATYGLADAALCQKCGASPGERHDRLAHTRPVQGEGS